MALRERRAVPEAVLIGHDVPIAEPPTRPGPLGRTAPETSWPLVLGVVSIVLGVGGIVCYGGTAVVFALTRGIGVPGATNRAGVVEVVATVAVAALLVAAGIALCRRGPHARRLAVLWAWSRIVLGFVSTGLALAEIDAHYATLVETSGPLFGRPVLVLILLALFAWYLVWPIIVLAWLARPAIRRETAGWAAAPREPES